MWLRERCAETAHVRVYPIAAITQGRAGSHAVDFAALAEAGAVGFSDDGVSTQDSRLMRAALEASAALGRPIMAHCEDPFLSGGSMHEGSVSRELEIAGVPAAAEESYILRDALLARETGGWLHALHVSTAAGIDLIRWARAHGIRVTAEVMPHHLVMTHDWVAGDRRWRNVPNGNSPSAEPRDPNTKVNPPLRTDADTEALLAALKAGDFDIIATDHAPHAAAEKGETTFELAAPGLSGLELAVPVLAALVEAGHLSWSDVALRLSHEPARLLSQPHGRLATGGRADLTLIDPQREWTVTGQQLRTKGANTPLLGRTVRGRAVMTVVDGRVVHDIR
jgi:dihydroorotase